jgi:uncharacterized protein (DUF934 family)
MPQLIKDRAVVADGWTLVRDASDLPATGPVIVPLATWTARRDELIARGDVGVWLAPADDPAEVAADTRHLGVVAVDFPQLTDGRGYSTGRLLRERYRYTGELRAIGDIQLDQLYYLAQCGFNAYVVRDDRSAEDVLAGLAAFSDGYQLTHARTPWFQRRAGPTASHEIRFPCE